MRAALRHFLLRLRSYRMKEQGYKDATILFVLLGKPFTPRQAILKPAGARNNVPNDTGSDWLVLARRMIKLVDFSSHLRNLTLREILGITGRSKSIYNLLLSDLPLTHQCHA